MIAIISHPDDPHAVAVLDHLRRDGVDALLLESRRAQASPAPTVAATAKHASAPP